MGKVMCDSPRLDYIVMKCICYPTTARRACNIYSGHEGSITGHQFSDSLDCEYADLVIAREGMLCVVEWKRSSLHPCSLHVKVQCRLPLSKRSRKTAHRPAKAVPVLDVMGSVMLKPETSRQVTDRPR